MKHRRCAACRGWNRNAGYDSTTGIFDPEARLHFTLNFQEFELEYDLDREDGREYDVALITDRMIQKDQFDLLEDEAVQAIEKKTGKRVRTHGHVGNLEELACSVKVDSKQDIDDFWDDMRYYGGDDGRYYVGPNGYFEAYNWSLEVPGEGEFNLNVNPLPGLPSIFELDPNWR